MFVALLMAGCGDDGDSGSNAAAEVVVDKWAEWEANPKPYGGLETLVKIRKAKESGATRLDLSTKKITVLTPLSGLARLTWLSLDLNQITDLTPLAGLTNLNRLDLGDNPIPDGQKAMLEKALPNCTIYF